MGLKAAFSSKWLTRAPGWRTSSETRMLGEGLGNMAAISGSSPNGLGGSGAALKVMRKYFAVTGAKAMVFSVEPFLGIETTT